MSWKERLLKEAKLYLILDTDVGDYDKLFEISKKAIDSGVDVIQLRAKGGLAKDILNFSTRVKKITRQKALYIINDRVDLALLAQADGVHLGQDDIPLREARKILGEKMVIGVSCQTLAHAKKAQAEGADYIGFGSIFKTLTKPHRTPMNLTLLKNVVDKINIPVFAIGGIDLKNIGELKKLGVKRVAVCRAICEAKNISEVVKILKKNLR